jgi:hypothetical protein
VCAAAPAFSGLACLFTVLGGIPLPALQCSGHPTLFAMCLYCSYWLLLSFSFFPWVGVSLSRGLCWSGPGLSEGVPMYRLAHLVVCIFPSCLGTGVWRPGGPLGLSIQHEVEMLCAGWRCGGVKVLPLLSGFVCKVYIQCLSKILL